MASLRGSRRSVQSPGGQESRNAPGNNLKSANLLDLMILESTIISQTKTPAVCTGITILGLIRPSWLQDGALQILDSLLSIPRR